MMGIVKKVDVQGFGIIEGADGSKVPFILSDVISHHVFTRFFPPVDLPPLSIPPKSFIAESHGVQSLLRRTYLLFPLRFFPPQCRHDIHESSGRTSSHV
jgi:hypothetical protein